MGTRVHAAEPGLGRGDGVLLQILVLPPVGHHFLESHLPGTSFLVGHHVVTIGMTLAGDHVDLEAVGQADLGLCQATGVRGNDGDATQLSLGHNNAPGLMPQRGNQEDLDAVPDFVRVLGGLLNPTKILD